ncbi:MAG: ATP-NAD kinase family protein [Candidatus Pelethousia sp.]|nr:ATP-NAD kinase family protein [Candidatus Pelethousia sp.]
MQMQMGFFINPVAGLGGRVALKGSDGPDTVTRALALGGVPEAGIRAKAALLQLLPNKNSVHFLTYGGPMGETLLKEMGFSYAVLGQPQTPTVPADTMAAAKAVRDAGAELLLFAGGDGTARDVCEAVGQSLPVLGIPAGVKMHSSVYALNPKSAGLAAMEFLCGKATGRKKAEVMDIDEDAFRAGRVSARLYGYMDVPALGGHLQASKSSNTADEDELLGMAGYIVNNMEPDALYCIGPGSTTFPILEDMGLQGTLLGVDVVQNGEQVLSDASEAALWALLGGNDKKAYLVVTPIGGQGMLFGRGNQQFSPRIIRRIGKANMIVAATRAKLRSLEGRPLVVDTGDPDLDAALCGYQDVIVDYEQTVFYKISDR